MIIKDISKQMLGAFSINGIKFNLLSDNTRGESSGVEKHLVNHWTAGTATQLFNGYHYNITEVNNEVFVFKTLNRKEKGQHVWGRNTGAIGNTLCCMYNNKKPTDKMIDALAILNAEQCAWYNIDPRKQIQLAKKKRTGVNSLVTVSGFINAPTVSDHSFFAKQDGYASDRWDIGDYMKIVYDKCLKYYDELKSGKRQFTFKEIIK